jgi:hypothetical protein
MRKLIIKKPKNGIYIAQYISNLILLIFTLNPIKTRLSLRAKRSNLPSFCNLRNLVDCFASIAMTHHFGWLSMIKKMRNKNKVLILSKIHISFLLIILFNLIPQSLFSQNNNFIYYTNELNKSEKEKPVDLKNLDAIIVKNNGKEPVDILFILKGVKGENLWAINDPIGKRFNN